MYRWRQVEGRCESMPMWIGSVSLDRRGGASSWPRICALAACLLLLAAGPAMSLPPNPERPNEAKTCAEAQERLREAELGSPLVSKQENAAILEQARAVVARLCSEDSSSPCPSLRQPDMPPNH